jgi:putative membrane protein
MKNNLILGRRVFKSSLVIATTFVTCAALQAEDPSASAQVDINTPSSAQGAGQSSQKGQSNQQVEKFVQKAMASGQMEVQMGQIGQTQAQNPQVKALADALVRDHTQANQKLQQIASTKSITADKPGQGDHQKHQQHLDKLKQQTGAEFDKEFVRMALKHHKKDIQEFEKAQTQLNDSEVKSFVSETLPKLRQHQQMAQAAAKTVGVDEASIAADIDVDTDSAVGGAAPAESGPREKSPILDRSNESSTDRPRSSIDGATETDASGTINQNNPSISADAQIGDRDLSADADVDVDDAAVEADVDTDSDNKVFEKGDGKVLGLPTDKNDGKFLGIIPNPRKDKDADADASIEADADIDVDADDASVGGSASVEKGSKSDE